jgi:hypothetical protein
MNEKSQFEAVHMDIFDIPVHPAADKFLMLDEQELEELAADIKANGLQHPLVIAEVEGKLLLVDGRNRREACRRVGVVPDHVLLNGQDPVAYIVSANINRRHLTVGQRAMLLAMLYPDPEKGGRGKNSLLNLEFSGMRLSQARTVLRYAPDLLDPVRSGAMSLNKAYEEARIRKGRAETHEARFESLKADAPDLAEMVVEEKLTLEEAEAAERERAERARHNKKLVAQALHSLAAHAYLLNPNRHNEVAQLITREAELYQQYNFGPVDEFIEALGIFEQHAGVLLNKIRGEDDVEKS